MKKLLTLLLSCMLVFGLSACTNNNKDTGQTGTTTQTEESIDDAFYKDLKTALEERWKIEEKDAELTTEIYTRYVDTELKYLSKYEHKEDSFKDHEIGEAAEDYVEALIEGKQMAYLIDKDYTKWHQEYEDEVFEESTEAVYKLNSIKKITFENEEYQQMFDRLVKYGEEYNKRD
ncbi:hypothetical protein [uncultured Catenibacterium sp.]|uniref:hypothetical protein n=1 Tax=uncultured Catenibacterium sp. TaxID=286142 RepID=UPI0025FE94A6|nr:hypothetical protein [uncultured Catenibacterium sp.]